MAMGANVQVLAPENWKKEIFNNAKNILDRASDEE